MANLFYGKGFLVNPSQWYLAPTWNGSAPTGWAAPQLEKPELSDDEDAYSLIKNALGQVFGITGPNDCILKATIDFVPFSASSLSAAAASASLPAKGPYDIAGFPIVTVGQFADAWNTVTGGSFSGGTYSGGTPQNCPWFYLGGGAIHGAEEGKVYTMSIPLMRFIGITGRTPVS